MPTHIDIFCGCGGMSLGFERAGFETILGIDNELPQAATFAMNRPDVPVFLVDARKLDFREVVKAVGVPDVLAGGPPCQGFSSASNGKPEAGRKAKRAIYYIGLRALSEIAPDAFLFENSPNVVRYAGPIRAALTRMGRDADFQLAKAETHGVPQVLLRAFLTDVGVYVPEDRGRRMTPREAFEGLGPPHGGGGRDEMHVLRVPGPGSQLEKLIPRRKPGDRLFGDEKGYTYVKIRPDQPTFSVNAGGEFAHWRDDRFLSFREYLRLQRIPDTYKFWETNRRKLCARILPPPLGQAWAESLKTYLRKSRRRTESVPFVDFEAIVAELEEAVERQDASVSVSFPNQTEQNRALERRIGDWFLVETPSDGQSYPGTVQRHSRGLWTEKARADLLADVERALRLTTDPDILAALRDLWKTGDLSLLRVPVEDARAIVSRAQDERGDVSAALAEVLEDEFPGVVRFRKAFADGRIVNRGNAHTDSRALAPSGDHLVGWTLDTPGAVVQFLRGGAVAELGRNKFLSPAPLAAIGQRSEVGRLQAQKKSPQPIDWLTLVAPASPTYEAAPSTVGATAETAGRFDLVTGAGQPFVREGAGRSGYSVVYGVRRSDFHEQFAFFEDPEIQKAAGGRWVFRLLSLGSGPDEGQSWVARRVDDPLPFVFRNDWAAEVAQARQDRTDLRWNAGAVKELERLGYFDAPDRKAALAEWRTSPHGVPPPDGGRADFRPKGTTAAPDVVGD